MQSGAGPAVRRPRALALAIGLCALAAGAAFAALPGLESFGHESTPTAALHPATSATPGATLRVEAGLVVARPGTEGSEAVVMAASASRAVTRPVTEGDEIHSGPDARAVLTLPRGVAVGIESSTRARVTALSDKDQRIRLDVGKVDVSVPKPGGPDVFVVDTPDAQVVVHGTVFSVHVLRTESAGGAAAGSAEGTETHVAVTRGAVHVVHARGSAAVSAGGSWTSAVAATSSGRAVVPSAPAARGTVGRWSAPAESSSRSTPQLPRSEALAEQNRLFQASLDARKAGEDARVVALLDELLARFPDTELGPEARLSRLRARERLRGLSP